MRQDLGSGVSVDWPMRASPTFANSCQPPSSRVPRISPTERPISASPRQDSDPGAQSAFTFVIHSSRIAVTKWGGNKPVQKPFEPYGLTVDP